jgi:hypothetical protein
VLGFDPFATSPLAAVPGAAAPAAPSPRVYAPPIGVGPPLRGAPWVQRPFVQEGVGLHFMPTPPPFSLSMMYQAEIAWGPAIRGAPWTQLRPGGPREGAGLFGAATPGPPANLNEQMYAPEIRTGPGGMRGAPWLQGRPFVPEGGGLHFTPPAPGTRGGPQVKGAALPFLSRVPPESPERRLTRFTEKLSDIINSLVSKGQLVQTGAKEWTLFAPAMTAIAPPPPPIVPGPLPFSGLVGTFPPPAMFSGTALGPSTGLTGTFPTPAVFAGAAMGGTGSLTGSFTTGTFP